MKVKDLIRLPLGSYKVTDGYNTYSLEKKKRNQGSYGNYCSLRRIGSITEGSVNFYEYEEDVFDYTTKYKCTRLKFMAWVSGLSFSGEDCFDSISKLKFISKSTYREFITKIEQKNYGKN